VFTLEEPLNFQAEFKIVFTLLVQILFPSMEI